MTNEFAGQHAAPHSTEAIWRAVTPKAKSVCTILCLLACVVVALQVRSQMIELMGGQHDYMQWAKDYHFGGLTDGYLALAARIRATFGYDSIIYPPGYPLFLALLQSAGLDLTEIRWVQISIDSLAVGATYLLSRSLTATRPFALLASLMYAAMPLWAAGSTFILAEWSSPSFLLWFMVLFASAIRTQSPVRWSGLGFLSGIAGMFRPDLVLLVIVPLAWLVLQWRQRGTVKCGAWMLVGFFAVVGSWGVHNRLQQGVWVFTSTGGGIGLWEGLGETPNDYGYVLNDEYVGKMMAEKGMSPHSPEGNRYLMGEYVKAWQDHPLYVLRTIYIRWIYIGFGTDTFEAFHGPMFAPVSSATKPWGLIVLLAAMVLKHRDRTALFVLAMPLAYALLSIGLTHYEPRYVRYVPISYLLSAIVVLGWIIAIIGRWLPRFGSALSLVLVAVAVGYVFHELAGLNRVADLKRWRNANDLLLVRSLNQMDWTPLEGAEMSRDTMGSLHVATTVGENGYQALFALDDVSCDFVIARFKGQIEDGGMALGALHESGQWAAIAGSSDPGMWEDDLAIDTKGDQKLTFVLANNRPGGGRSRFTLSQLSIYVPPTCAVSGSPNAIVKRVKN